MWLFLILSGLAPFLELAGADDSIPKYMLVLPARLNYPSSDKLCMDLGDVETSVVLSITLETKNKTHVLLDGFRWHEKQLKCLTFTVPPPADGSEEVAAIRLSDAQGKIDEQKQVLIQKAESGTFLQMDKPIYSPGQLVQFRIITLDEGFMPLATEHQLVELQDPAGNRIAQWNNVQPDNGVVQLSYQLAAEPMLGVYRIIVDHGKAFLNFEVLEYVIRKFEVVVVQPAIIYSADSNFPLKVCGRYTYGKPVRGLMQISLCQKAYRYFWRSPDTTAPAPTDICQDFKGQTDRTGCFSATVELSQFRPSSYEYSHSIDVEASLEEAGTGVQANVARQFYMSDQAGSMNFVETDDYYHQGYPFRGKLKALQRDGSIMKNHDVFLVINLNNNQTNMLLTTDSNGIAEFSLDTEAWNGKGVSLEGRLHLEDPVYEPGKINQYHQNAFLYLQPYYTTAKSTVKVRRVPGVLPCNQEQEIQVDYSIKDSDLGEEGKAKGVTFSYYVTGKGKILMHGQKNVGGDGGGLQGSFSISLTFTSDFAPQPSLVVYSLFHDGGAIADKISFEVSMCFKNQVSLGLSQQQELPGTSIDLELKATPGSLCAIRAVDQSVLLLRNDRDFTNTTVYDRFYFLGGYPYQVTEYDHCDELGPIGDPMPLARSKRYSWRPWFDDGGVDFFSFLKVMGLKVLSNNKIKKPATCRHHYSPYGMVASRLLGGGLQSGSRPALASESCPWSSDADVDAQVRQNFPETWIWKLYNVDPSGEKSVALTVPDTITEWKVSMFCTSQSSGLGISSPARLTVFKPFFVDVTLPYSVIRGESFPMIATVFNYLKHCMWVQVILSKSEDYQVQPCKDCEYTSCLCAGEAKTYSWNVKASKLGVMNFTITTMALKSEQLCGGEQTAVPEKGRSDTLIKSLLVRPEGVLAEKAHSSLLCPEGASASDSFSLELPEDVVPDSARAQVSVLGYQRQLQYKHRDGSYSAFGESDGQGNTWLTAFVIKVFSKAEEYTFIDDEDIQAALRWLASYQQPDGSFANVGKLFHRTMKGGVNNVISLTAYIIGALLEAKKPLEDPVVKNGLDYLKTTVSDTTDIYVHGLLAYVFTLAGDVAMRQMLLTKLDQQAIKSGGQIYWSPRTGPASTENPWSQPESVSVELTAYVLLARLSPQNVSKEDIKKATDIVAWLAKQQNAYGGFASTQDTVVALQALAKYGAVTYTRSEDLLITVKSDKTFQQSFHVDDTNRLVLQQATLPDIPGEYAMQASGKGCGYVQAVLRYNIPPSKNEDTFTLDVKAVGKGCGQEAAPRFLTLHISASYVGSRGTSNMAMIEVKMLSGFHPVQGTNHDLKQQPLVKRVEIGEEHLTIYLDQLGKERQTYTLAMSQDIPVKDLKPAAVKVYDYYQPDEQSTVEYEDPCY
ncbi:alpha-2-macroglobulin-like protein 1 isoform X2 [Podarcis raffonei]|uniref:alpha-2-macroglobulin-like protein 1 isoform X2 n=1 Tax=Podarcis raffonei TaxID=65483 RepID=UPI0023294BFD|nr:alpha-2-macroglobulin-like protein 1 isoform X2 [Podarcis raffonei]